MAVRILLSVLTLAFLFSGIAQAETKVTLSEMHLCCGACTKAVMKAVDSVEGAAVEVDQDAGTSTVTAADDETATRALLAIAKAGFHGKSDNATIAIPDDSGAPKGKVERIELTGIHNCCGGCNKALVKALGTVEGAKGNNASPKNASLVVEGDFFAQELIDALYKAGFHGRVKQ